MAQLPAPSGDALWLGPHAGILRRMVHALKYQNAHALARVLARLLHARIVRWGWLPQVVTHLPTSAGRRRARGYDQAQLLAKAVAQLVGVPYASLITRTSSTPKLVGLGRRARAASLANALTSARLHGQKVLLIDDVLTTGASVAAGRLTLARAGAGEIRVAVVARTAPARAGGEELARALERLQAGGTDREAS